MIALSGAVVVLALLLLVAGLASSGLAAVYASILASVVSAVLLVIGVLQRRPGTAGGDAADGDGGVPLTAPVDSATDSAPTPAPSGDPRPVRAEPSAGTAPLGTAGRASAGIVFVPEGSDRYHQMDCTGVDVRTAEPLEVEEARFLGATGCPICRPDEELAAAAQESAVLAAAYGAPPDEDPPAGVVVVPGDPRRHRPGCPELPGGNITTNAATTAATTTATTTSAAAAVEAGYVSCPRCGS